MEVAELVKRANERLKAIVGEEWELDLEKLGRIESACTNRVKTVLHKVSYSAVLSGSELVLGMCHSLPFSAICLYILGREAGAPVTILDAAEAVAESAKEGDTGIRMNALFRLEVSDGASRVKTRVGISGPVLWYDSGCHRLVFRFRGPGNGEEERALVLSGHRMAEVVKSLGWLGTVSGIEVEEVQAYALSDLEGRLQELMSLLRQKLAGTGVRLVAHVGAEGFLRRGLRALGREDLMEKARVYLGYGLGQSPAYSAALASLIAITSEQSPEKPTYLDVARAFGVSAPVLVRRHRRLVRRGLLLK